MHSCSKQPTNQVNAHYSLIIPELCYSQIDSFFFSSYFPSLCSPFKQGRQSSPAAGCQLRAPAPLLLEGTAPVATTGPAQPRFVTAGNSCTASGASLQSHLGSQRWDHHLFAAPVPNVMGSGVEPSTPESSHRAERSLKLWCLIFSWFSLREQPRALVSSAVSLLCLPKCLEIGPDSPALTKLLTATCHW